MRLQGVLEFSARHPLTVLAAVTLAAIAGWAAMLHLPLDATPDLGDRQVIIFSRWDRSPQLIEDQVTYPIVTAMLGAPRVKTVRGVSDFGYSYVYVTFEDGTDLHWARNESSEYLSSVRSNLPEGVRTELGPDATALGWVFQYALADKTGQHNLADLRTYQDWYLRYQLRSVPGVAEVASLGGYTLQYQVNLNPALLKTYNLSLPSVVEAIRNGNKESSGRLLEFAGAEYMVRGHGYAHSVQDLANIPLLVSETGSQIRVKDVGRVEIGPDLRRGAADLNGRGEVVSGIVVMRNGENALDVISRVKARLNELKPSLPAGIEIVPIYDRSELIHNTLGTVTETVVEVGLAVAIIILIFLWHFPSAAIPIVTMPIAVLLAFLPFRMLGLSLNIMSLTGVALAFSELVDASVVVAEQVHKKLEIWEKAGRPRSCRGVVLEAMKEVSVPAFFALLVIAVSFLPVLLLPGTEGRMFRPLAYTKSITLVMAAALVLTLDPALRVLLTRPDGIPLRPAWLGRIANRLLARNVPSEDCHPLSRRLIRVYEPVVRWTLRQKRLVIGAAVAAVVITVPVFLRLGTDAMPPLDEGALLYMPSTLPGISIAEAKKLLQYTDSVIHSFPEVATVLGKAGRADTATDPAPLSMLETVIVLKPRAEWPRVATWYSSWAPGWATRVLRHLTPDTMSTQQLIEQMDEALRVPGLRNGWTMPIRGRVDMLTSGIRTPLGLKISGADISKIQEIGVQVESILHSLPSTRAAIVERSSEGYYLDIDWDRERLAEYGLSIADAQTAVENAMGGDNTSMIVSGRERYPVNVRLQRDFRSGVDAIARIPIGGSGRPQVPLSHLARISRRNGPAMIRDENGFFTSYLYLDIGGRDIQGYVSEAAALLQTHLKLPPGYSLSWSGQYEEMQQTKHRLLVVVPITLAIISLLLFINTGSATKCLIVLMAVPFSAVGAVWFLYLAGYHMSAAVWVGLIALLGIDAETGVFMLLYLELARENAIRCGRMRTIEDLREAIVQGAAKRIRPKFMTFATCCIGLFPIMWSNGTGADLMKSIAAPLVGGIFTSFLLELIVYPAIYEIWRGRTIREIERPVLEMATAGDAVGVGH